MLTSKWRYSFIIGLIVLVVLGMMSSCGGQGIISSPNSIVGEWTRDSEASWRNQATSHNVYLFWDDGTVQAGFRNNPIARDSDWQTLPRLTWEIDENEQLVIRNLIDMIHRIYLIDLDGDTLTLTEIASQGVVRGHPNSDRELAFWTNYYERYHVFRR